MFFSLLPFAYQKKKHEAGASAVRARIQERKNRGSD